MIVPLVPGYRCAPPACDQGDAVEVPAPMTRRTALKRAGALAAALAALEIAEPLSAVPERALAATSPADIQFDISAFLSAPPNTYGSGVLFQMPPVHTVFLTAALHRTPVKADQAELNRVLAALEQYYPWGAAHLVTFLGYGLPYFGRFPGGAKGSLVSGHMPRLTSDHARYVLEEAQAGPTDVSPSNPGVRKRRYNVDVVIESNDMLFTLRSDKAGILKDVLAWFGGSNKLNGHAVSSPAWNGLLSFTSSRSMFVQMGLPKSLATNKGLPYAARTAQGIGTTNGVRRMGHLSCLQRSSRAADGTPIHLRMDGPGFDAMDVPGGTQQPKLQFTMFVPTAEFFRTLRMNQASPDLQAKCGDSKTTIGLERFITATRRQNFLVPPRRHRAFPLVELA